MLKVHRNKFQHVYFLYLRHSAYTNNTNFHRRIKITFDFLKVTYMKNQNLKSNIRNVCFTHIICVQKQCVLHAPHSSTLIIFSVLVILDIDSEYILHIESNTNKVIVFLMGGMLE